MTHTPTTTSGAADLPEARLFTKKPVTIAAIQWTGKNLREVIAFTDGPPDTRTTHAGMAWEAYADLVARDGLKIYTLEGKMLASPGDWIIRGVKGEYYPCKPDIFEATYSPAALAAGQATAAQPGDIGRKSIDMVLHCPKCGLQHIDKDNSEDLRIEAAELGVDREGERRLERWIEEREWPNPPHRSHLCQNRKCGHIWRPADVPTNGVAAIKTAGTKDDPITSPSAELQILKAEHDNLKSSYGRLKLAYDAWHEKTNWIHKTIKPAELGQHIADVMTARLLCLGDAPYTLTQYFEFEERIYDRMLRYYMASGDLAKVYPAWQVKVFECIRTKKLKKPWELTTKEYTFELARDIAKTIDEA